MKKIMLIFITIGIFSACKNDDDDSNSKIELTGNWKLIEVLADPGDGSGTFNSVESDKTITFNLDGTINSNGRLCDMSLEANNPTNGTYSISELTFNSSDCTNPDYNYEFEQNGNFLIINYPCFEPCRAKYMKE
jgi:hypothetical protein